MEASAPIGSGNSIAPDMSNHTSANSEIGGPVVSGGMYQVPANFFTANTTAQNPSQINGSVLAVGGVIVLGLIVLFFLKR